MTTSRTLRRSASSSDADANRNSCLLMLVIYVVLSVVYTLVLQHRLTAYAIPLAMALAVFGTLFLASAISIVVWPGEVRWLRAAIRGERPEDGALCAISGRLDGTPQPAPISEKAALAWSIEVYARQFHHVQNQSRKVLKLKGISREPLVLNGPAGSFRLSGALDLGGVSPRQWTAEEVMKELSPLRQRGKPFEDGHVGVAAALDELAALGETDEAVRFDPVNAVKPEDTVEERILKPDQTLCAIGVFDRTTGSLVGRRVLGVERIQILPGGPRRAAARMMRKTLLGLAAMTFLFLLSHGLIGALIFL